jgi:hypothetical protein
MKAQAVLAQQVSLSQGEALQEFRKWISAELLNPQRHWLGAESRPQKRTKAELLAGALGLWVHRHPEERLTKAGLFNVMREAVGELIALSTPSETELPAQPRFHRL